MQNREFYVFQDQMRSLEKNGIISNLTCHPNLPGFFFNLGNIKEIDGYRLYEDFSRFKFKILFNFTGPKVYPRPLIKTVNYKDHINSDDSLCLYHYTEFNWFNNPFLDKYIVPWIFMWQVYYNEWKRSGKWLGPEYPHVTNGKNEK